MSSVQILKGNILYSKDPTSIAVAPHGFLVAVEGTVEGVYDQLPDRFSACPTEDFGDALILPGMTDLHLHAPQYTFRGTGMDLELLEWLQTYTFPEEAKYGDPDYAETAYSAFAERLRRSATTRACIFATLHTDATLRLMELLENTGLSTMVGKVNMDRNSPAYLCEADAAASIAETKRWLKAVKARGFQKTQPILTPRFIPSCSDALLEELAALHRNEGLPVQSHLSENPSEVQWVKELCPWAETYGDAYDRFGLFGSGGKTIMAHCVYSPDAEIEKMKAQKVFVAHCPESNINLSSGVAPVKRYLAEGLQVGLGTDLAAGSSENLFAAMAYAIQASKLRWRLQDDRWKPLTVAEAFYMATKGGGAFFGKVGSFEKGYALDALVIDDARLTGGRPMEPLKRLERAIYLADEREIRAKYVGGAKLF